MNDEWDPWVYDKRHRRVVIKMLSEITPEELFRAEANLRSERPRIPALIIVEGAKLLRRLKEADREDR